MRKIVAGLFISLDGVTESPEKWQMNMMDDEADEDVGRAMEGADTILLGRRTYDEFAAFWPNADPEDPFAAYINTTPKLVVSNSLTSVDWQNSSIISGTSPGSSVR